MALTDHGSTILLPSLLERLRKDAPHSELILSAVGPDTFDEVAAGRIDLSLCAEGVRRRWKTRLSSTSILSVSLARANESRAADLR